MSLDPNPPSRATGTQFAIALLGIAVCLFFASQIVAAGKQSKMMSWQMDNTKKQIETATANEGQFKELIKQQDVVVKQVATLQSEYQKIFEELLTLAEKDKDADAEAIVKHWNISRNEKKGADTDKDKEKP
jgi:cephalosporin hydroxylase